MKFSDCHQTFFLTPTNSVVEASQSFDTILEIAQFSHHVKRQLRFDGMSFQSREFDVHIGASASPRQLLLECLSRTSHSGSALELLNAVVGLSAADLATRRIRILVRDDTERTTQQRRAMLYTTIMDEGK